MSTPINPNEYSRRVMAVMDSLDPQLRDWLRKRDTFTVQLTVNPNTGTEALLVHQCRDLFGWINPAQPNAILDFNGQTLINVTYLGLTFT